MSANTIARYGFFKSRKYEPEGSAKLKTFAFELCYKPLLRVKH